MHRVSILLAFVMSVSVLCLSQSRPSGGGGGGTNTGGTTGNTTTTTTTTTTSPNPRPNIPNPNDFPSMDANRPIYLRGKVILDQGGEVAEPVAIQRVCGATVRREGYSDMHGNFSIMVGDTSVLQDASEAGYANVMSSRQRPVTTRQLWGCEIRAMLPGYSSTAISLAGRDFGDMSSLGNIVLHRLGGGGEGNSISVTSLKAPDKAKNEYRKALESYEKQKFEDADKHLAKALEIYPQYASAWELRGREQQHQKMDADAIKSYEAAISADDKFVQPYIRLASVYSAKGDWSSVVKYTERAIQLDPSSYPDAYLLNGAAHYNLKQFDEAERSATKAVNLDREHRFPRSELLLGSLFQMRGNPEAAATHFRAFLKLEPNAPEAGKINDFLTKYDQQTASAKPVEPAKP